MDTRTLVSTLLVLVLTVSGCGDAPNSTGGDDSDEARAVRTMKQMLEVAERGDWGAYVDRFYGEQHKFGSPADRDKLVKRFENQWGAMVLPALRRAAALAPRIDGDQAVFEDATGPAFTLRRGKDGAWTFHL